MIQDNALSDRLNAVKQGKNPPVNKHTDEIINNILKEKTLFKENTWAALLMSVVNILDILLASGLYGFALKGIFALDLSIYETLGIGFVINNVLMLIPRLFKLFKKS